MQMRSHSTLMAQLTAGRESTGAAGQGCALKAAFQSLEVMRPKIIPAPEGSRVNAMHASGEPWCSITKLQRHMLLHWPHRLVWLAGPQNCYMGAWLGMHLFGPEASVPLASFRLAAGLLICIRSLLSGHAQTRDRHADFIGRFQDMQICQSPLPTWQSHNYTTSLKSQFQVHRGATEVQEQCLLARHGLPQQAAITML